MSGAPTSGVRAAREAASIRTGWPLLLGLIILVALWAGPLPALSRRVFSIHMMLHLGVTVVAAPLIAIGLTRSGLGLGEPRHPIRLGFAASAIEMAIVWGWHAPALHNAASVSDGMFAIEQISFLAAGMAVWTASLSGASRAACAAGAVATLTAFMHMVMLGMLLVLAPVLLYAPAACQGAWGLSPLQDQQMGGAIMAVGGGLAYLIGGTVLAYRAIAD